MPDTHTDQLRSAPHIKDRDEGIYAGWVLPWSAKPTGRLSAAEYPLYGQQGIGRTSRTSLWK